MNKKQLVNAMSKELDVTKISIEKFIEALQKCIITAMQDDDYVKLIGFGTFKTFLRKANKGKNPRTGEVIQIPTKRVVKFVSGYELKKAINMVFTKDSS